MHGFADVAQDFLREWLGVAHGLCTISPRVSLALQGDASNAQLPAALAKLCRAVTGAIPNADHNQKPEHYHQM